MKASLPKYVGIPASELGRGHSVKIVIKEDTAAIGDGLAAAILQEIRATAAQGRGATLIVPVGPVDHWPILARRINQEKLSCRRVMFINMDEYLSNENEWVPEEHPLSFRGHMNRCFYDLLDAKLAPPAEARVFPRPTKSGHAEMALLIGERGGVDACYGGIGINGHIAFNEPPEPGQQCTLEAFAALPTRVLDLSRETITINSVTVGGEISVIPRKVVTIGMREILASRKLRLYCNRPWQSALVRRVLFGPITPACPASLLRMHPDAMLTITGQVAAVPQIQLR